MLSILFEGIIWAKETHLNGRGKYLRRGFGGDGLIKTVCDSFNSASNLGWWCESDKIERDRIGGEKREKVGKEIVWVKMYMFSFSILTHLDQ